VDLVRILLKKLEEEIFGCNFKKLCCEFLEHKHHAKFLELVAST